MEELLKLDIPLPPLAEQQRIAAILREQMAAAERARRAAEEQLEAAKALPAAFLRQVFPHPGQPLPEGWRWVRLGEVCKVQGGFAFKSEDYRPSGVPVIRISNLVNETVEITADTVFVSENAIRGLDQFRLQKNDLLIAMSGATTGKLGVVPESILPAYLNQRVGRFLPDKRVLDIDYLRYFLGQTEYLQNILTNAFGAAIPNVSPGFIESLDLILPPLAEQQRIAAILREQMAAAERVRQALEEQLEAINKLPAAILRKAFEGRL